MAHNVTLIPGDGIGPEVADACVFVTDALGVKIEWDRQPAGLAGIEAFKQALPEQTLASIRKNKVALKGPTTTPVGGGHTSANVAMRRAFNLFASVRPVKSSPGIATRYSNVDLVIFRENTEGLYAGLENTIAPGIVVSLKVVTEAATRRISHAAFSFARAQKRKKVTVVHKANILKQGDGLFLRIAAEVAKEYSDIVYEECIVDALCMRLVKNPSDFDVLLMENLYGDIVSDLCAGLVGGLGVVPGANLGEKEAIFEAVHGAAPDIAGKGLANPTALLKSASMMLVHLGESQAASRLENAIEQVLRAGEIRTGDLGGKASTQGFCEAIVSQLKS